MNTDYLQSIGTIWTAGELPSNTVINPEINEIIQSVSGFYTKAPPKSVLITGEKGVGKTSIINLVAGELKQKGWFVFIATAGNLMAGQRYIGDLEKNVQNVLQALTERKKTLWIVPSFQELYYGGRHEYSPVGILDQILPHLESGRLHIIGEVDSRNLEKVIQYRPQLLSVFEIVRISVSSKEFTIRMAGEWIKNDDNRELWEKLGEDKLEEIFYLANQYLSHKENPGCLIDLLKQTKKVVESQGKSGESIEVHHFIQSLSNTTGLPANILDDREKLDLEELKAHFAEKVIGQEEAVETMVERIAMIKAGLTDPSKPSAVFLFVGPTGTGKTEIAKALAEYLFASADRLIRLDMSEYQTFDSTYKILGSQSEVAEGSALVNLIRKNPFSVVLLDEFEKAHPSIWDLFLQVFDDGRLTDQRGAVADFRHCIIIMTSNLGASLPTGNVVGFNRDDQNSAQSNVYKTVGNTFRPEFVNRIDRIVVFNPLTKAVVKVILKNELKNILRRRGLRQRKWEIDLEDSAIEFLLEKGFSSEMGARPLKRALERYLLAPLATTIVNHNFPKGDQFLLVSRGRDELKVEFIDPDEPDLTWNEKKEVIKKEERKSEDLSLSQVIMEARGALSEFRVIKASLKKLNEQIDKLGLSRKKSDLLNNMAKTDFWEKPERFQALSDIEFIDRFESALETANNLYNRLEDPDKERVSYDPVLIRKLAQRIYLLKEAIASYQSNEAQDVFLKITYENTSMEFAGKLTEMYQAWAKNRGMRLDQLRAVEDISEVSMYYQVSGFGAFRILGKESGQHVFEEMKEKGRAAHRHKIKVAVLPKLLEDYRNEKTLDLHQRFEQLKQLSVARRYRIKKSPVIKDLVRNWQTGKADKVLNGDFDLIE